MVSELLTLTQAAALTGTSTRQLRYAVTRGTLPAKVIGRAYCVARADLDAWQPPAPGASLDAYWRARGKRGKGGEAIGGIGAVAGLALGNGASPTYAPALVRMRDGSTTPAEVIVGGAGLPDSVVDFGLFSAKLHAANLRSGGTYIYDEV